MAIGLVGIMSFIPPLFASSAVDKNQITNVIVHVTSSKQKTQQSALNYVNALLNNYGNGKLNVEVITVGPGVGLVNTQNRFGPDIQGLISQGVNISACNTSLNKLKKNNQPINIVEGVDTGSNGVVRLIELQKEGYHYVHP
ncbi:DsrE family protein [Gammaproteobacteria bacterium AH-315-K14]|nr:DsrE family protein [Gammaproteobacteria bacterium AH-315-K14]